MTYKSISVVLSEDELQRLRTAAARASRRPQDQARFILLRSLRSVPPDNQSSARATTNDKSAVNVCETKTGAFVR